MFRKVAKLAAVPYGVLFRERRPGLVILAYHRVGGRTTSSIDLPAAEFARQMACLRERHTLISMDAVASMTTGAGARRSSDLVAVTFDDGTRDLYDHAFPILVKYRIPATVYLTTDYVETQRSFDFGAYARSQDRPDPLSWAQVREMVESGLVAAGAHTHTHQDLTRLAPEGVRREMAESCRLIEDRVGTSPQHFAYPWGRVTPSVRQTVGEFVRTAVRGGSGKNPFGALDLLALWRRPIQQSDVAWVFDLKLRSYLDGEEHLRALASRLRR